jgi:hypothetical protein
MTAPMTLNDSTLPTYIVKCTICYFKLDNTLIADLKKIDYSYRVIKKDCLRLELAIQLRAFCY